MAKYAIPNISSIVVDEVIQICIIGEGYLLQHIHKLLKIIKKQMD